jgi:hypothetical protein
VDLFAGESSALIIPLHSVWSFFNVFAFQRSYHAAGAFRYLPEGAPEELHLLVIGLGHLGENGSLCGG